MISPHVDRRISDQPTAEALSVYQSGGGGLCREFPNPDALGRGRTPKFALSGYGSLSTAMPDNPINYGWHINIVSLGSRLHH